MGSYVYTRSRRLETMKMSGEKEKRARTNETRTKAEEAKREKEQKADEQKTHDTDPRRQTQSKTDQVELVVLASVRALSAALWHVSASSDTFHMNL